MKPIAGVVHAWWESQNTSEYRFSVNSMTYTDVGIDWDMEHDVHEKGRPGTFVDTDLPVVKTCEEMETAWRPVFDHLVSIYRERSK